MKKPPKVLHVNPLGTSTEAGKGFIGFLDEQVCVQDLMADHAVGLGTPGEIWIYELKMVKKVQVTCG